LFPLFVTGVNNTCGKFTDGILTPETNLALVSVTLSVLVAKFTADVVDTSGKFTTGVVDISGAP
jgi:hypothetical protein